MGVASEGGLSGADGDPVSVPGSLVRSLAGFARTISLAGEVSDVLQDLADRARSLAGSSGAGVNVFVGERLVHVASSRPALVGLEAVQEEYQEGPGVDAARSGEAVMVSDLGADGGRWPRYSEQAGQAGIRAVAAIPLTSSGSAMGAINLYHSAPRSWTDPLMRPLVVLGDLAAGFLVLSARVEEQRRVTVELQRELDGRVVVEQARGIIAARRGIGMDQALELLRRHAERRGASLEDVAGAVIRLGLRL